MSAIVVSFYFWQAPAVSDYADAYQHTESNLCRNHRQVGKIENPGISVLNMAIDFTQSLDFGRDISFLMPPHRGADFSRG